MEDNCHFPLIGSTCIFQPEGHDSVVEVSKGRPESCLFSILWIHLDLILSTETIHKGEVLMIRSGVNESVDVWQMEFILWASFVQVSKIDTMLI